MCEGGLEKREKANGKRRHSKRLRKLDVHADEPARGGREGREGVWDDDDVFVVVRTVVDAHPTPSSSSSSSSSFSALSVARPSCASVSDVWSPTCVLGRLRHSATSVGLFHARNAGNVSLNPRLASVLFEAAVVAWGRMMEQSEEGVRIRRSAPLTPRPRSSADTERTAFPTRRTHSHHVPVSYLIRRNERICLADEGCPLTLFDSPPWDSTPTTSTPNLLQSRRLSMRM
ncbi:hypothetical protein BDN70DRAFT_898747 [Pholiota conissans]|uniref:Uncharacterized protein n=1 Tax=Pholiota conissans TaxID=109636 RepID=A0A9P6CPJ1_9AGAR|nr:hypothetical protein BDN70DRAFT_898747 [Pholiota conissans]